MLSVLARYLHCAKQLHIPHIGSFEMVQLPATLDIADKLIYPPAYEIQFKPDGEVDERQLDYLGEEWEVSSQDVLDRLQRFGQELNTGLTQSAFTWTGLGTLQYKNNRIEFQQAADTPALDPVEAHKVLRESVRHTVLIGEQEVHSSDVPDLLLASARKRSYLMPIAWILLALAILFIIYYFYREGLKTESSGLKSKVFSAVVVQTSYDQA